MPAPWLSATEPEVPEIRPALSPATGLASLILQQPLCQPQNRDGDVRRTVGEHRLCAGPITLRKALISAQVQSLREGT
jgi:hypothetical protein